MRPDGHSRGGGGAAGRCLECGDGGRVSGGSIAVGAQRSGQGVLHRVGADGPGNVLLLLLLLVFLDVRAFLLLLVVILFRVVLGDSRIEG